MFTGLIETTGTVLSVASTGAAMRLIVAAPALAGRLRIGDSVAVNGTCLTALDVEGRNELHPGRFAADLAAETVERTTLPRLVPGALVNLELPTPAGAPLGGHVVQGHVDARGTLRSLTELHPGRPGSDWRMVLELPAKLRPYVVPQGSIAVDGISLTVASVRDAGGTVEVEIAVIPHTYANTNLRSLLSGAAVNIETDVLGKYAERRQQDAGRQQEPATHPLQPAAWTAPLTGSEAPQEQHDQQQRPVAAHRPLSVEDLLRNGY